MLPPVLLRLLGRLTAARLMLLGARRVRVRIGSVKLVVYLLGPRGGEPWLLLHGLGSTALSWAPVLAHLRRQCRLVVPELSSLGGSRIAGDAVGIGEGAEVAAALVDRFLRGRPATVAGISLGGWMAVRLALAHPQRVSRLVLIDAGGYRHQDWDEIQRLVRVDAVGDVDRLYQAIFARTPWIFRISRETFLSAYTSRAVRHILETTTEEDAYDDHDLARIEVPVGLVWGEHDGLFPVAVAERMQRALRRATLTVLPGCAHAVHWEAPRLLCAAIDGVRASLPVTAPTGAAARASAGASSTADA
jgi:pimeloyl-ACP methyl ester carboxylesterase